MASNDGRAESVGVCVNVSRELTVRRPPGAAAAEDDEPRWWKAEAADVGEPGAEGATDDAGVKTGVGGAGPLSEWDVARECEPVVVVGVGVGVGDDHAPSARALPPAWSANPPYPPPDSAPCAPPAPAPSAPANRAFSSRALSYAPSPAGLPPPDPVTPDDAPPGAGGNEGKLGSCLPPPPARPGTGSALPFPPCPAAGAAGVGAGSGLAPADEPGTAGSVPRARGAPSSLAGETAAAAAADAEDGDE